MILTKDATLEQVDFLKGITLLIDKPLEWTSFDVVNKVRYALKRRLDVKKIKVGHAGTLDPLATGLLLLCTGKATKGINDLMGQSKTYEGEIKLGATTSSYDRETEEQDHKDISDIDIEMISFNAKKFVGEIDQKPPLFSAIKKNGKALYKYARKGVEVEVPLRRVVVGSFDIVQYKPPIVGFEVNCSKGTYIRSLAYDLGEQLGCGAYLHALRRTKIGDYSIGDAWNLEELIEAIDAKNTID